MVSSHGSKISSRGLKIAVPIQFAAHAADLRPFAPAHQRSQTEFNDCTFGLEPS